MEARDALEEAITGRIDDAEPIPAPGARCAGATFRDQLRLTALTAASASKSLSADSSPTPWRRAQAAMGHVRSRNGHALGASAAGKIVGD